MQYSGDSGGPPPPVAPQTVTPPVYVQQPVSGNPAPAVPTYTQTPVVGNPSPIGTVSPGHVTIPPIGTVGAQCM